MTPNLNEPSAQALRGPTSPDRPAGCSDCLFWKRPPFGGVPAPPRASEMDRRHYLRAGYCRKGAPAPGLKESDFAYWPITLDDDWCGSCVRRDT